MIKKILLACAGGFSTSMLVQKMQVAAKKQNLSIEILAVAEDTIDDHLDSDVILLGPQIGHRQEDLAHELSIPVYVIEPLDYGTMNGEKVLNDTLRKLEIDK